MKLPRALVRRLQEEARRASATDDHRLQAWAVGINHTLKEIRLFPQHSPRSEIRPMATKRRRSAPLSSVYRVVTRRKKGAGGRTVRNPQKREAIREAHRTLRRYGAGARAEVTTKEGALIYQAHARVIAGRLRIVSEEL